MSEKVKAGPIPKGCNPHVKEAVCVHVNKVYDSCREKDCLENLRVFLTACGQELVDKAINVKARKSEIIWVYSDVNRSMYNILKNSPHIANRFGGFLFIRKLLKFSARASLFALC